MEGGFARQINILQPIIKGAVARLIAVRVGSPAGVIPGGSQEHLIQLDLGPICRVSARYRLNPALSTSVAVSQVRETLPFWPAPSKSASSMAVGPVLINAP